MVKIALVPINLEGAHFLHIVSTCQVYKRLVLFCIISASDGRPSEASTEHRSATAIDSCDCALL